MIRPIGYSKSKVGTCFSIFFMTVAAVIAALLVKGGADWSDAKYIIIGGAVLAVFFILSDVTTNLKNRKNILHMNEMLQAPYVKGEIKEIRKSAYVMGKLRTYNENVRYKHYVYQIVVIFSDEEGNEKTVISEPYSRDPQIFLNGNSVNIHCSSDGVHWIEPIDTLDDDKSNNGGVGKKIRVQRKVERNGKIFAAAVMTFSALFLAAAYLFVKKIMES